jgi:multisubunit Na+/H+ antiporter MnhC subunit
MIIYISIGLFFLSVLVSWINKTNILRVGMAFTVMFWAFFLLYFYMGGLARRVGGQPPKLTGLPNLYLEGISAYYFALTTTQISLAISIISLFILVVLRKR